MTSKKEGLKIKSATALLTIIGVASIFLATSMDAAHAANYDNDTEVKFIWTAASGDVNHYNVYVSSDGGECVLTGSTFETSYIVKGEDGHTYKVKVEAVDAAGNVGPISEESDPVTVFLGPAASVNISVLLEGPYESDKTMRRELSIPTLSPYADARRVETVPENAVDWVYLEIRSDEKTMVRGESMFLLSDGNVVSSKDETRANFYNLSEGNYFVVIRHRNHLAIMSKFPVSLVQSGDSSVDLTVKDNVYGENVVKELASGIYGMYAGDIDQDGEIATTDFEAWYNAFLIGESGYKASDVNLNSEISTADFEIWYNNFLGGASSQVPDVK